MVALAAGGAVKAQGGDGGEPWRVRGHPAVFPAWQWTTMMSTATAQVKGQSMARINMWRRRRCCCSRSEMALEVLRLYVVVGSRPRVLEWCGRILGHGCSRVAVKRARRGSGLGEAEEAQHGCRARPRAACSTSRPRCLQRHGEDARRGEARRADEESMASRGWRGGSRCRRMSQRWRSSRWCCRARVVK